jgi:hypothetical protein
LYDLRFVLRQKNVAAAFPVPVRHGARPGTASPRLAHQENRVRVRACDYAAD